jgi:hypothetical protein
VTRQEIEAWRRRWQLMNELELEELRSTPPEECLRQLEAMYASVDVLGCRAALEEGEAEVRGRWIRLKDRYGIRGKDR